jgi:hypothetical protein
MVQRRSLRSFAGCAVIAPLFLLVSTGLATNLPNIENMAPWETCSSCALRGGAGASVAHSVAYNVPSPSLSGSSTQFNISGSFPYANAVWWKQLGGNDSATHFTYDLYFYIKNPGASEALEFDVNQSTGGRKYIMGTQCGINYDHQWDVWDTAGRTWRPTSIPCTVNAYAWNHLTEEFYRANSRIYYVSLTINGTKYYINRNYASISSGASEINVAFQMDQTGARIPYSVWLDNVTLNYW